MSPERFLPQVVLDHLLIQNIPFRFFFSNAKGDGAASARNFVKAMWQPSPDRSKYVLMSDNDILMPDGSVQAMIDFLDQNEDFGAIGMQRGGAPELPKTQAMESPHVNAGPVLFRTELYDQITYHNNNGCECQGMSDDIRELGFRIGFIGSFTYDHIDRTKRNDFNNLQASEPNQTQVLEVESVEELDPVTEEDLASGEIPVIKVDPGQELVFDIETPNPLDQLNCLQIGFGNSAEYTYLVGHQTEQTNSVYRPEDLSPSDRWYYYGVDSDPVNTVDWNQKQIPNTNWINVFISNEPGVINIESVENMAPRNKQLLGQTFFVGKITLSQLIENLNLNSLEILAMDLNGYEIEVFDEYDWDIKPQYLIIEAINSDITIKDSLAQLFANNGYEEVTQTLRNDNISTELVYRLK